MINIILFLVLRIGNSISSLFLTPIFQFQDVAGYLAIPANISVLLVRPWTFITYMFLHWDVLHIFFNMLFLFWMGRILQEYLGNKKLLATYIMGGIIGGIFFVVAYNIFPLFAQELPSAYALGASASVLAITIAAATLLPEYRIHLILIGEVALKWIALVIVLLDLINLNGSNAGGHLAHLGGALYGFVYIRRLKKGNDLTLWLTNLFDYFSSSRRMKVTHRKKFDEDFNIDKKAKQEKMDDILDKISKSGYGSLTQEEKNFLFRVSKED